MWNSSRSQAAVGYGFQLGRVFLSSMLLSSVLVQSGIQEGIARDAGQFASIRLIVLHNASCAMAADTEVVQETPESDSTFDGFVDAARRKKDAAADTLAEVAPDKPVILITAGNAIGGTLGSVCKMR